MAHGSSGHHSSRGHYIGLGSYHSTNFNYATVGVLRDHRGRIKRSTRAKNDFKREYPCPSTGKTSGSCPGYVIDHVKPLKRGGEDAPRNMQWQTVKEAKAKDRTE